MIDDILVTPAGAIDGRQLSSSDHDEGAAIAMEVCHKRPRGSAWRYLWFRVAYWHREWAEKLKP